MSRSRFPPSLAVATFLALAPCGAVPAQDTAGVGDLLVAPTRVVLEGSRRTATISLVNRGAEPALYRISLDRMRMLPGGDTVRVEAPEEGELFADHLLQVSPRQVLLPPGSTQTVRILVRKPSDLAPAEYRSHLTFRAVPSGDDAIEPEPESSETSIVLRAVYGVSIPVIVRHGETSAIASIREARLVPSTTAQPAFVRVTLERQGNRSVYGDVTVWTKDSHVLGVARGVGVWCPNAERSIDVPIDAAPREGLGTTDLEVTYVQRDSGDTARRGIDPS